MVHYDVFLIKRLIHEYDRLFELHNKQKRKPRPPISILKSTPVWGHFIAVVNAAASCKADPFVFLAAQFCYSKAPYPPQLSTDYAVKVYNLWVEEQKRKYAYSTNEAITAASVTACSDKSLERALSVGSQIWNMMKKAHGDSIRPLDMATSAAGILPPQFLLSFKEVEDAVRSGAVKTPLLTAMVDLLDQAQNRPMWDVIRKWQQEKTPTA
jgi:hypothetical protein